VWRELGHRLAMIVVVVAVATGIAVPASAGLHHDQTSVSVAMGAGHPAACVHDGCPTDQNSATQGACFSACAGITALPSVVATIYRAIAYDVMTPTRDLAVADRDIPPDPRPPKHA
jgi:hypothetical protein